MRKINLICVGNLKEKFWVQALDEYCKRIQKFFDFKIIEIAESKIKKSTSADIDLILKDEAEQIISKIKKNNICILSVEGETLDSVQFAQIVSKNTEYEELNFVIGGSWGLSDKIKSMGKNISFGRLTYPHQLMRVIFAEQLYRAGTILNNIEYHK